MLLGHEGETHAVDRRSGHDLHVVDDQRSIHGDREGFPTLLEFPSVHTRKYPVKS